MYRSLTSAVVLSMVSGVAFAADLPSRKNAPLAPTTPSAYSHATSAPVGAFVWDGFYVGAHAGYGLEQIDGTESGATGTLQTYSIKPRGFMGGVHGGYNLTFGSFLAGLEADLDYTAFKKSASLSTVTVSGGDTTTSITDASAKSDYQGSIVGRLGYTLDNILVYGLGGLAAAHNKASYDGSVVVTGTNPAGPFVASLTSSKIKIGWTVGAGAEYAFTNNWIARAEYRYADFGKTSDTFGATTGVFAAANSVSRKITEHTINLGLSYKFDTTSLTPLLARY